MFQLAVTTLSNVHDDDLQEDFFSACEEEQNSACCSSPKKVELIFRELYCKANKLQDISFIKLYFCEKNTFC